MFSTEIVECHVRWEIEVDFLWCFAKDLFLVFPVCESWISYEAKCIVELFVEVLYCVIMCV